VTHSKYEAKTKDFKHNGHPATNLGLAVTFGTATWWLTDGIKFNVTLDT